ncbi:MAG: hypothetical protein ACI9WC_003694 [Arenicella sp.]|jgi:hypothetical protein
MVFFNYCRIKVIFTSIGFLLFISTSISYAEPLSLPDPLIAGWKGKQVCEHLYEDTEKRILRCTFPPNVGHERHYHVAHFGYAVKGGSVQITDTNGVRELDLTEGSSYSNEGVPWHEIQNIGKTTIIYLIVETKERAL